MGHPLSIISIIFLFSEVLNAETINVYGNLSGNALTNLNVPTPWSYWINLSNLEIYFKNNITTENSIQYQILNHHGVRYISYQMENANSSGAVVSGNNITYSNIFNYTDITYIVNNDELSKDIRIRNESAPTNFTFKFQTSGVNYTQESDTSITFYDNVSGERVWAVKKPFGYDS